MELLVSCIVSSLITEDGLFDAHDKHEGHGIQSSSLVRQRAGSQGQEPYEQHPLTNHLLSRSELQYDMDFGTVHAMHGLRDDERLACLT